MAKQCGRKIFGRVWGAKICAYVLWWGHCDARFDQFTYDKFRLNIHTLKVNTKEISSVQLLRENK